MIRSPACCCNIAHKYCSRRGFLKLTLLVSLFKAGCFAVGIRTTQKNPIIIDKPVARPQSLCLAGCEPEFGQALEAPGARLPAHLPR